MTRIPLSLPLCAFLALASCAATAQPGTPAVQEACAAYTASGEALLATVSGGELTLSRGRTAASAQPYSTPLTGAIVDVGQLSTRTQPCDISISRRGDEAAVGVHYRSHAKGASDDGDGVVIYRFHLDTNTWGTPVLAPPPAASRNGLPRATAFAGYWMNTHDLVTVDSAAQAIRYDVQGSRAETKDVGREYTTDILSGVDAAHNRVWLECPSRARSFMRVEGCTLHTLRLFGGPGVGPHVASADRYPNNHPEQWGTADFFAYPNASTLLFGGAPVNLAPTRQCLWTGDLDTSLAHSLCLDSSDGFTTMTGQASTSSDAQTVAVLMESAAPGASAGSDPHRTVRLLLADMLALKHVATLLPPGDSDFAAFAIDHRRGSTEMVVNWGSGWEDHTYPDVEPAKR